MLSKTELGEALLESLEDISALLEQARSIAIEEQDALVKNDAEVLVKTCRAQEEILRRISEADQRAADAGAQLTALAGLDPQAADAGSVAQAAGMPHRDLIEDEIRCIGDLATEVRNQHEINAKLLENGLDIVACCLRTLASDTGPSAYSKDAALSEARPCVLSLDRRA